MCAWSRPTTHGRPHGTRARCGGGTGPGRSSGPTGPGVRAAWSAARDDLTTSPPGSALHAQHRAQAVLHPDQVGLLRHDRVEVLVRAGDLVDHAGVLAALDALGLGLQVGDRELPARRPPRHAAPGPVRRRPVGLLVPQPGHDERPGAHRAGDDPLAAALGGDGALAGHDELDAVVGLLGHVVVVAGHLRLEADRAAQRPDQCGIEQLDHHPAVEPRVLLCPVQVGPVGLHLRGAGEEHGQVAVGQLLVVRQRLGLLDVQVGQDVADPPRPGVQHQPDPVVTVEAELHEVISAPERPELLVRLAAQLVLTGPGRVAQMVQLAEAAPEPGPVELVVHPEAGQIRALAVPGPADRDVALDLGADPRQRDRQVGGGQVGPHRGHAAADVDVG
ncbi:hypothetical protein Ae356Ps1_6311c [Pseudonocardia sp. Ae356_Ps1]|nr:hypothetical protein Ae356Ps1_6311c [Pseudonocardia sp. Ae356_Ps1]